MTRTRPSSRRGIQGNAGLSLVEVLVVTGILGVVFVIVTGALLTSSRLHDRTTQRAEVQMSSRQGMSLMMTEIRQAGADSAVPPIGLETIVTATATSIRVRSDLNGSGTLTTAEPSEDVTYTYDAAQGAVMRNPGSGAAVVVPNVTAMAFRYFDANGAVLGPFPLSAANRALVRAVEITLTSEDRTSRPITLTTRIALRNL